MNLIKLKLKNSYSIELKLSIELRLRRSYLTQTLALRTFITVFHWKCNFRPFKPPRTLRFHRIGHGLAGKPDPNNIRDYQRTRSSLSGYKVRGARRRPTGELCRLLERVRKRGRDQVLEKL
ncbi:hypothetical protein J1N35_012390 [Gossypium stocksii]|uniref:Uncharacterized protein n=1 Tax=Gossypium stocksii TaxID=47602 RepID=A0A9D3W4I9_9ROSI|nr:hypothetical protein J1N35_012390 [Gossypium stocksii]